MSFTVYRKYIIILESVVNYDLMAVSSVLLN